MFCKHCGYQISGHANFCPECGRKLSRGNGRDLKWLKILIACVLVVGIGIGIGAAVRNIGGEKAVVGQVLQEDSRPNASEDTSILHIGGKNAEIRQVLPIADGSVAVLYEDGTVRASENAQFSGKVSDWERIKRLYCKENVDYRDKEYHYEYILVGLTEAGTVRTTAGDLSGWNGVEKLYFPYEGIVGVTGEGKVLLHETEGDLSLLEGLTDVKELVCGILWGDIWGCLKKDGTVYLLSDYTDPNQVYWTDVKELRDSGHAFYVIKNDGTVDGQMYDDYAGLKDAVKVVDYSDWLFGISADGRLLTHNGGNIYTNTGAFMVDEPGVDYYAGEVDIAAYDQVKDIMVFDGLFLLNEDGTVDSISVYPEWNLSGWKNIEKIYGDKDWNTGLSKLYGLRKDGSVILATATGWEEAVQTEEDNYRGWKLKEIYVGDSGVVGLTTEETLVGDGIYEMVDFSVFDR